MKIAIVTRFAHVVGGVETYLQGLLPALAERGHDVRVWHDFEVPGETISIVPSHMVTARLGPSAHAADLAVTSVAQWKPEVIFSHGIASVATERRLQTVAPFAVLLHAYHGTCVSGHKTHSFPSPTPCTRPLGPGCLVRFHAQRCGGWSPLTMVSLYAEQRLRRSVLRDAGCVATLSEHMRQECIAQGVDPTRVNHLPAFAPPLPEANARTETTPTVDGLAHLMFAGRMDPLKGAHVFLEALEHLAPSVRRKLRVTLVGDGSDRARCERQAARLREHGVASSFLGWLSRDTWIPMLRTADLLVVPSLWPEPLGLVGLEASSVGVPSLAFDVGGIREWLHDGVNGYLVRGKPSAVSLARGIEECLSDPQRLRNWGTRAHALASSRTVIAHTLALERMLGDAVERWTHPTIPAVPGT